MISSPEEIEITFSKNTIYNFMGKDFSLDNFEENYRSPKLTLDKVRNIIRTITLEKMKMDFIDLPLEMYKPQGILWEISNER